MNIMCPLNETINLRIRILILELASSLELNLVRKEVRRFYMSHLNIGSPFIKGLLLNFQIIPICVSFCQNKKFLDNNLAPHKNVAHQLVVVVSTEYHVVITNGRIT